ncbi:MAG: cellulase family glycosylhydrolase [Ignavibacteriaceae bacterium]
MNNLKFGQTKILVNSAQVIHEMKGGIGASWHALSKEIPLNNEKYDYPVRLINSRGSAYGGNPPAENNSAWEQINYYAKWLGLNFIRVEISQRMYEPERNIFDWNNEEMSALYRILDWCEINKADVFLQQMWGHVEWNAYPGVHPLLSAPYSIEDFAAGIYELLNFLVNKKGYSCVKYFCITNEPPGGSWGYWWCYGSYSGSITAAIKKVRETLDEKGINIPLSGPGWTSLPPFDESKIDFEPYLGAYDIHSYNGINFEGEKIISEWVKWAHDHSKPFFLTEFGNMNLGWGADNPGPKSFAASLSNASDIITCLNLGTDGFNRWSFTNRGDLDGQWQLIRTWDAESKCYLKNIFPESSAYFGFAILSRFLAKYSKVLKIDFEKELPGIKAAAVSNKSNIISIFIVNNDEEERIINLNIKGINDKEIFYLYQADEEAVSDKSFELNSLKGIKGLNQGMQISLEAKSITTLSNFNLSNKDFGIIE